MLVSCYRGSHLSQSLFSFTVLEFQGAVFDLKVLHLIRDFLEIVFQFTRFFVTCFARTEFNDNRTFHATAVCLQKVDDFVELFDHQRHARDLHRPFQVELLENRVHDGVFLAQLAPALFDRLHRPNTPLVDEMIARSLADQVAIFNIFQTKQALEPVHINLLRTTVRQLRN